MKEERDSRLQFLNEFGYGSIHLPLESGSYYLSGIRAPLEKRWESAQPSVSSEILHKLEQKVDADSKSYCLAGSQNRCVLPVDLRSAVPWEHYFSLLNYSLISV